MRWLGRVAAALLALAALLVAAGWFGPDLVRGQVARAAGRALGRDVSIGHLALLAAWPPTVAADDIAASGLGHVPRMLARIAPWSLLSGRPVVEQVTLIRPAFSLTPDAHGRVSILPAKQSSAAPPPRPPPALAAAHPAAAAPSPRVVIQDGSLSWRDPRIGPAVSISISGTVQGGAYDLTLHGQVPPGTPYPLLTGATVTARAASGKPVHATVDGVWNGQAVQAVVESGTPEAIAAGGALPVTVVARAGGAVLHATGLVAAPSAGAGLDLAVTLQGADEQRLAALLAWPPAASGPVSLAAHVAGGPTEFAVRGLDLRAPQGDVAGDVTLSLAPRPSLRGALRSQRLDLDAVLAAVLRPAPRPTPTGAPVPAPPPSAAATLIPDRPLPFASLARADADLTVQAASLRVAGVEYRDLTGHLALQAGRLELDPCAAVLPGGARLSAALRLDGVAAPPAASLVAHAPAVQLAPLLAALHLPAAASGLATLDADLRGAGATPHALASTLVGTASIRLTGAAIDAGIAAPLLHATRLPLPLDAGRVGVPCAAVGVAAANGMLSVSPLVADAGRVRVEGGGTIDLGQETMDLHLLPTLRSGPGLVIPVRVTGPWRAPKVQLGTGPLAAPAIDADACPASPLPASAPQAGKKHPKGIDILRSLLR